MKINGINEFELNLILSPLSTSVFSFFNIDKEIRVYF